MKKVRLTEESYNKLVNEISYNTVDRAFDKCDKVFEEMTNTFRDFYDTVKYNADKKNPYVIKIKKYADAINNILERKYHQASNFDKELNGVDVDKFYNDKYRPEVPEDYNEYEMGYLKRNYPKD